MPEYLTAHVGLDTSCHLAHETTLIDDEWDPETLPIVFSTKNHAESSPYQRHGPSEGTHNATKKTRIAGRGTTLDARQLPKKFTLIRDEWGSKT